MDQQVGMSLKIGTMILLMIQKQFQMMMMMDRLQEIEKKRVQIMGLLKKIIKTKSDEEPDTTDMPELESEESAARKGLKILTPDQMHSTNFFSSIESRK